MDLPGGHDGPFLGENMDDEHISFLAFGDFSGNQNFKMNDG